VWIKENNDYKYVVIGIQDTLKPSQQELAFGGGEMMEEFKKRIERLVADSRIGALVNDYNVKILELEGNSNINKFEQERKRIWRSVDKEAKRIRGHCHECSEEYLKSHFEGSLLDVISITVFHC
jgi:hypothetical protein